MLLFFIVPSIFSCFILIFFGFILTEKLGIRRDLRGKEYLLLSLFLMTVIGAILPFVSEKLFRSYEFFFVTMNFWEYGISFMGFDDPYKRGGVISLLIAMLAYLIITPFTIIFDLPLYMGHLIYEHLYIPTGIM